MFGPAASGEAYRFGDFRLEADRRVLVRHDEPAPVPPKAFDTLLALVRHAGELVGKDALMQAVWPDQFVDENNLNQSVAVLRRVLQDRRGLNRYIETVQGRGFRFVAPVERVAPLPAPATRRTRVAVLPFTNLTGDADREYVVDGFTEETIAALGQVEPGWIAVLSRATMMDYKGASDALARVGRELGADYAVDGSLREDAGRTRVTAALVRVRDRLQLWSATFDNEPASLLGFQRELALAIARQVRVQLEPERVAAMAYRQPSVADALDCYLRGRHFWHQLTPPTTRRALELFRRATEIDPGYALAWSGIADALCARPIAGDAPPLEMSPPARAAVEQALASRPVLAETQASAGFLAFWLEWDWPAAEARFLRAIELDPSYPLPYRMLGLLYSHLRRADDALPMMRRCRDLDPMLPVHHALSAHAAFACGEYELAVQLARQALSIDPEFWIGHFQLAQGSLALGDLEQAWTAAAAAETASGGNSKCVALRGYLHARHGRAADARAVLAALEARARDSFVPPCSTALVHAALGEFDAAASQVERAVALRDVHLMFLAVDPKWEEGLAVPRIAQAVAGCGFTLARSSDGASSA